VTSRRFLFLSRAAGLTATALSREATAAPPWVERHLTMPSGDVAFDLGMGVTGSQPITGGVNLELGIGLTSRIELGFRTGVRFGDAFEREVQPDAYARLYDLQTIAAGDSAIAKPEVRLRGALVQGEVGEVGLEGRLVPPFDPRSDFGLLFGVPVALHFEGRVRFDTGVYVGLGIWPHGVVDDVVSVPIDLWIQATPRFWIGPVSDIALEQSTVAALVGVGLGYQIVRAVDFKATALVPAPSNDVVNFAVGAGVQIRIE
jgi:hypothetical protein